MMQRMVTGIVFAALVVFIPASALAQKTGGKRSDDCGEQRKHNKKGECTLIIDGEEVGGEIVKPDQEIIKGRTYGVNPSLVRIRVSFEDKVLKSAENL
jgi:hypothetical protein